MSEPTTIEQRLEAAEHRLDQQDQQIGLVMELLAFLTHPSLGRETKAQRGRFAQMRDLLIQQFPPESQCVAARKPMGDGNGGTPIDTRR